MDILISEKERNKIKVKVLRLMVYSTDKLFVNHWNDKYFYRFLLFAQYDVIFNQLF
jgi:hypothetical protein